MDKVAEFGKSFVSLAWLDGSINFIFRFVAKTSELLLAIGIIISAADFLTDGRLMHNNLVLADAWAWTQAIAIESSSGVVLMYALQAFRDKDKVKGWCYIALATLLALVGGVMLLTQIILSITGINLVTQGALWFIVGIAIARTVVSIAYVVMCRIKHIRFSGLIDSPLATPSLADTIDETIKIALATQLQELQRQWEDMHRHQFDSAIQEVTRTVIKEVTQSRLIAIPREADSKIASPKVIDSRIDRLAIAKEALSTTPAIKDKDLAKLLQCSSINTARSWKQKALAELEGA